MTTLSIRNLWKTYGRTVVLENVSLEVKDSEFITVVGASGCGKSTFLRILLGEESCTRGSISLNGVAIPKEPGPDRGIVFQRYSAFPHLTVRNNVLLGLELSRAPYLGRLFGAKRRAAHSPAPRQTLRKSATAAIHFESMTDPPVFARPSAGGVDGCEG